MTREKFKNKFIVDVKIAIHNREECMKFQEMAFSFGVKIHSLMNEPMEKQTPIAYNIADVLPDEKGKSYATDMTNLVIYDNGTRLQQSGFFGLENEKKLILFDDMVKAYNELQP